MERGNNTIVRVCMIGFGIAIAAIAPVVWVGKIPLFLSIMLLVGVLLPAIQRRSTKSVLNSRAIIARKERS
jgi:hypothetical protein